MLTLKQNQNDDYDISSINSNESQIKDNNLQNYKEILKKNPTYKKTYDNTGYLFIGHVANILKDPEEMSNVLSRYKQKHILVPQNEKFTIWDNQESIRNFLTNIKQNYKINNFHFYLRVYGNKRRDICATFKYTDENGENKSFFMNSGDVDMLLHIIKEVFKDDNLYIYVTNTPCYDNDLIQNECFGEPSKRFREHLIEFTKDNKNIKFLFSHHYNSKTPHSATWYLDGSRGNQHRDYLNSDSISNLKYEVIENGEMHTITKDQKNRIFYSPENRIKHDTIRPQDVLKYIDSDYTFLDKNGNSKGKIKDVIGNKDENEYTFDHLAQDIVNTYENTNKIRFLKRGYFKPFYDAIKDFYDTNHPNEISNKLIQRFHDIEDTIRCTC